MAANTLKDLYKYDSSYMDHQGNFSFDSDSDLLENIKSFMFINFSLSFKYETITSNPDMRPAVMIMNIKISLINSPRDMVDEIK